MNATIIRFADYAKWVKESPELFNNGIAIGTRINNALVKISPDLTVQHGPFKGMKYPRIESVGSTIAPKLIGSYERELHPLIESICDAGYSEVIDIGCAEGYYAVGLAMRLPNARVFAYDTDTVAIDLCKEMATLNHVADRVILGSFCTEQTLQSIPYSGKALIISDCEGYERHLFTPGAVKALAQYDVLVEIHDFLDLAISSEVREAFKSSHDISIIHSIDDIMKVHTYSYEELNGYDLRDRMLLLEERRPSIMEWYFFTPRHQA